MRVAATNPIAKIQNRPAERAFAILEQFDAFTTRLPADSLRDFSAWGGERKRRDDEAGIYSVCSCRSTTTMPSALSTQMRANRKTLE
jgi:hypothetical protein